MKHPSNPLKATTPFSRRKMLGLGSVMLLSGCSGILPGQGPPPAIYRLTPKSTFRPDLPEVDWQLVVETPVSNASLNTTRIALQRSAIEIEYFAGAGWIDRAPEMLQTLMVESFENSRRIVAVGRENVGLRADLVLKVELREFEAIYVDDMTPEVLVTFILKLVEIPRRAIIGAVRISAHVTAQAEGLTSVIDAFDIALGKVLKRSVEWTLLTGERNWQER
jgi:cholesterol transport system auxiliary component